MQLPPHEVILEAAEIAARIEALADVLAREISSSWTAVALLQGAIPFAADLLRALAGRGVHPAFDSLWLESYRDARASSGRVAVRADLSRPIEGRKALLLDEVFDSGRTIGYARAHLLAQGATEVRAAAFIRKPAALAEPIEHIGFDAPDRFLIGYGMDDAGRWRGLPFVAALR